MRDANFRTDGAMRPDPSAEQRPDSEDGTGRIRGFISGEQRGDLREGVARVDGIVPETERALPDPGAVLLGRERSSGAGRANGSDVGAARGGGLADRLRFQQAVPPRGYAWWYLDAFSSDGRYGLTVIAFIGSVFSPYYFRARRRNPATAAEDHCALNVALYGEAQNAGR